MAKQQNTFAKRARETEKRRKANAKLERRRKKKEQGDSPADATGTVDQSVESTTEREPLDATRPVLPL